MIKIYIEELAAAIIIAAFMAPVLALALAWLLS